jgi:RNA polymerase sigma-70 factor (ECF subfamily)
VSDDIHALVGHVFRHEHGRILARLLRRLGPAQLPLAEDAVQFAMVQALRTWPFHGIPDQPSAWLARVAQNKAIESARAAHRAAAVNRTLAESAEVASLPLDPTLPTELDDDRLALLFTCCHPAVPHASRVALTLNVAGGFSVRELARAFVVDPASMAQRLVRAKRLLAEHAVTVEVPTGADLGDRLDAVLQVIYLLFNEGYEASGGESWVRTDLCDEALRLIELVAAHPATATPAAHALASLLHLLAARLPARLDDDGVIVLLEKQDRARWDEREIAIGLRHLAKSARGDELTSYHVQAEIAALHAAAPSFGETRWSDIATLYGDLLALDSSPVIALHRAVAVAEADGPAAGLAAVDELARQGALDAHRAFHAVRAELLRRTGQLAAAAESFGRAAALPCSEPQRRWLLGRQRECEAAASTADLDGANPPDG